MSNKLDIIVYVVLYMLLPSVLISQVDTAWVRTYNGTGSGEDVAQAIVVDYLGNIYITGYSKGTSGTYHDCVTIKYDSNGDTLWVARYNGPGDAMDWALDIAVDDSGNVYICGLSEGVGTDKDALTIKYNSVGDTVWVRRYNGPVDDYDNVRDIVLDDAGNVYVTGQTTGIEDTDDYLTIKYSATGVELWSARYNGSANAQDWATAIAIDGRGNICVTGFSTNVGTNNDFTTIMYDAGGDTLWTAIYNGPVDGTDFARAIAIDQENSIYVTGFSEGIGTEYDYLTVKYDSVGNEEWVARYDGIGSDHDNPSAITVDDIGNVYVTGQSRGIGTYLDYATVKYNYFGDSVWVARYNGPAGEDDKAYAIVVDNHGSVYVTGDSEGAGTYDDCTTIKYDSLGLEQWNIRYDGLSSLADGARDLAIDSMGYVYITGRTSGDYLTIKYIQAPGVSEQETSAASSIYRRATIFRGPLQLPNDKKCKVFDITGRVITPQHMKPGVYFIEVNGVVTRKLVKIR